MHVRRKSSRTDRARDQAKDLGSQAKDLGTQAQAKAYDAATTLAEKTQTTLISSTGLSPLRVGAVAMASTTALLSSSATSPKIVCLKLSQVVGLTVMKNCDPLVPGPALAMASR